MIRLTLLLLPLLLVNCERADQNDSPLSNQGESTTSSVEGATQTASAEESPDIILSVDMWDVPWEEGRSRDPFASPDGRVFFAGQQEHYIGYLNPDTGEMGYHELEDGAGPHTVIVAPDGTLWYAGNRARHIGKMDPDTGDITKYMMEDEHARDPHTFAMDRHGNIWFTAQRANGIGYFNTETGETTILEAPTSNSLPYGIRMDNSEERPWIALLGTNKLATVDPETFEIEEIELPRTSTRVRRLDVTSDGKVWYGDYSSGYIGRYDPSDGSIEEWEMPDGRQSQPYAVLTDDKDRLWLSAAGLNPNKLVAFDTRSEQFVASEEIEQARGSIRHMMFDSSTRSLWFGTDTGYIGRLVVN